VDAARRTLLRQHLALALVPGLGPKLTQALLERFGTPERILAATAAELERVPLIGTKLAKQFADGFARADVEREWNLLETHGVDVILRDDASYPARLRPYDSAPSLLYCRGRFLPEDDRAIGIVGSRMCTSYGKNVAAKLAEGLARAGWTVVSGLARGIDACAHRGALDAGGRTIAVLANGLSTIYPPEHADLAQEVISHGALLTETPMTVAPQAGMFPARNRIISGLSRAVVIVEANVRSGALITASHAAEQGVDVYAVPGAVDSPASAGCLDLIRKGARLIRNADDLIEDLQGLSPPMAKEKREPNLFEPSIDPPPAIEAIPPPTDPKQRRVWDALESPRSVDDLVRELELSPPELVRLLMTMELTKKVKRLPGNQYARR